MEIWAPCFIFCTVNICRLRLMSAVGCEAEPPEGPENLRPEGRYPRWLVINIPVKHLLVL